VPLAHAPFIPASLNPAPPAPVSASIALKPVKHSIAATQPAKASIAKPEAKTSTAIDTETAVPATVSVGNVGPIQVSFPEFVAPIEVPVLETVAPVELTVVDILPAEVPVVKAAVPVDVTVVEAPNPLMAPEPPMPSLDVPYVGGKFHVQDEAGQYSFSHWGGPNTRVETKDAVGRVAGSFAYVDPEGEVQVRKYAAGPVSGFRVAASDLPEDTPEVVEVKSLLTNPQ